jgi:YVTN family beta-propeller protein
MAELPSGTVTFLFTDIEGSTKLERHLRERYGEVLREHQQILREAFAAHGGHEIDTQGDSFFYAFPRAKAAVDAAVDAQRTFVAAHDWPPDGQVRVRMGISTGEAAVDGGRYVGFAVVRAARISAAGHGGQILLSSSTRDVVESDLGQGLAIRDLGERRLKDFDRPERISQLVIEGLQSEFGQLKTLDVELKKKRRRLYAGAALIGVLVAAVVIPVFALGSGGGGTSVTPNSVAIIDPSSNDVVDSAPVGVDPDAITVGAGAVWVANTADQTVSRIDPSTRRVVQTIPVGEYPSDVAVAAGSAWVALGGLIQVRRIDVASNQAEEMVTALPQPDTPLPALCQRALTRLAAGDGALWFTCILGPGTSDASRIDPRTRTAARVSEALFSSSPVGIELVDVVAGLGSAWYVNRAGNTVVQVATDSLLQVREVQVGSAPEATALIEGSVWVANGAEDTVSRLVVGELAQASTLAAITVGDEPVDVASGEGAVWVANRADATVSRIDPESGAVVATIPVGNVPTKIAVGAGAVWVTVQAAR